MVAMYGTLTSKGQFTVPAAIRRELGLRSGQKLAITTKDDQMIITAPRGLATLRRAIRDEAIRNGTWGTIPTAESGWDARAEDFRADA